MRLAPTPAILLLVASVHCALPLRNGGFEEGLRHWNVTCAPAERCGSAAVELYEGSKVAALQATADQWTSMQLQQKLDGSFTGEDAIDVKASVRAGPGTWRAPMEMKLSVVYEGMGSCQVSRLVLPTSWEDLRVRCAPARGAARQSSTVAWVVIEFACVRSEATLLVDNVVATTGNVRDDGSSAPSVMTAAIAAPEVPRILHFVFGLSSDFGGKPFGLVHHLVIKAALRSVSPTVAYFHHAHTPSGTWWDRTQPLVALRRVKPPTSIFGRVLRRFPHQADVLRLELLLQFGGVYMDMDVMLIQPIGHLLSRPPPGGVVLAHEGIDGTIGAGNAMMLTTPNASVLVEWYSRYRTFSDNVWNGFSVRLPMQLAIAQPGAIRLLDYTAFYWPPWNPWGIAQLYRTPRCLMPASMGVHLWETKMWKLLLQGLTPEIIAKRDTCFSRMAAAVHDGSFNFAAATLDEGMAAETVDKVVMGHDLSGILQAAPDERTSMDPLPMDLARFRRK